MAGKVSDAQYGPVPFYNPRSKENPSSKRHEQRRPSAIKKTFSDYSPQLVPAHRRRAFWRRVERPELSKRDRSLVTVTALIAGGNSEQLPFHLEEEPKENGVTEAETHRDYHPPRLLLRMAKGDVGHRPCERSFSSRNPDHRLRDAGGKHAPRLSLRLWPGKSDQQKTRLAHVVAQDVTNVLNYGADAVSVAFEEIESQIGRRRSIDDIVEKLGSGVRKATLQPARLTRQNEAAPDQRYGPRSE